MASVEALDLQITADAQRAQKSLDALIKTLERLKAATKGSFGLNGVAKEMDKVSKSSTSLSSSNTKSATSFVNLGAKITAASLTLKKAGKIISSWIKESNDYVENVNLFTVAMGEYAESAKEYAEEVSEVMGIDPSDWMRNQGVFMTLATGFGAATDRAAIMSQQLTQLGYDLSSFFNLSVKDSMTKLQSGLAGELEPLRRLGYDLSNAKLEAVALSLGIDKAVSSMTQAEKAELRYYAIMTQVTTAQGDMSRTLEAPANQLRVLSAQATQAARALGNIFIPALNAVLPYAIAFLKVVREAANWLANLFGFSLPEIDYSGVEGIAASGENASDALDDAAGSAKKLKKTLLGIDELNVLSDTSSSGAGGVDVGGGSLGFELPEYDFMGNVSKKTDAVYNTIKKLLKPVKKILDYLMEYKEFVLLGLGLLAVTKLWGAMKGLWAWFMGIKVVDWFMTGFSLIRVTGGSVLQSIRGGFQKIRMEMSPLAKAVTTAVAAFVEFTVIRDNVKAIALGAEDVGAKIAEMGVIAGIAATAMYVALGPAGLALAAVVAIAGAFIGLSEAAEESRKAVVDAVFFDGVGTSLDAFKTKIEMVTEAYRVQNEQIAEWKDEIDSSRETVEKTNLQIETLSTTLGITGTVTQEEIEKIKGQFATLYEGVKNNMSLSEEIIMTALVGALKRATPEIAAQIDVLIGEYQRYVRETQGRAEELRTMIDNGYDQLVGKQRDDPAYQEIMNKISGWYTELGYLSGGMSDAGWQWQQTVADFNSDEINFGDVETAKEKIGEIATVGQTALADIATARDAALKEVDNAIAYASKYKTEDLPMLYDIREKLEADYAAQEADIKKELTTIFESIQTAMINKVDDTQAKLKAEWAGMSWTEQVFSGPTEEEYVRQGLLDLEEIIGEISTAMKGHMDTLETDGSVWASDAMNGIITEMFGSTTRGGVANISYEYYMDLDEAVDKVFSDLEESGKKISKAAGGAITEGLGEGVSGSAPDAVDAMTDVVDAMDDAVREAAEINSPSKLFEREGGFMMDGLIKSIKDKVADLKASMSDAVKSAFSSDDAASYGSSFGKSFGNAVVKAIKNTSFPTIKGTVTTSGTNASIKFNAYASGGFPTEGEMFVAREAGPELVGTIGSRSAVVNNDQIVESVSQGVYQAVSSAMGQSGGSQVVEAKVNDKVLFEVVVNRHRQETMRTGVSPLLGGV